jgi:hypothetical protein
MSVRVFRADSRGSGPSSPGDRETDRVLALLGERDLTVSALRDQGIEAPGQAKGKDPRRRHRGDDPTPQRREQRDAHDRTNRRLT